MTEARRSRTSNCLSKTCFKSSKPSIKLRCSGKTSSLSSFKPPRERSSLKNKTYSILYRNAQNQVRQLLKMSGFQIENEVRHDSFISMLETFKNNEPQEMNISQVRNSKRQNCTFTNQGVEKKRIVNFEDDGLPTDPYGRTWI